MPARILPPVGMRTGPCPSTVGDAGCTPLIVTTALVMSRFLSDAKKVAAQASRMKATLQVRAGLPAQCEPAVLNGAGWQAARQHHPATRQLASHGQASWRASITGPDCNA